MLSDNDIAVVVGALQLFLKFPTQKAATKLVELANSRHRIVRALAISVLAIKPSKEVINEVEQLAMKSQDRYMRACATVALASLGSVKLRGIDKMLKSDDPIEHKLALHALLSMNLPHKAAIERMQSMLNDTNAEVRLTAPC